MEGYRALGARVGAMFLIISIAMPFAWATPAHASNQQLAMSSGFQSAVVDNLEFGKDYAFEVGRNGTQLQYVIPKSLKGYVTFQITPMEGSGYLSVSITANYKRYTSATVSYGNGAWSSGMYALKPNTKVTVSITSPFSSTQSFKIKGVPHAVQRFEKEGASNKIAKLKKTYTGVLMSSDSDKWVFKAPKTGKYRVSAVVASSDRESCYCICSAYRGSARVAYSSIALNDGWQKLKFGDWYSSKKYVQLKKGKKLAIKLSGATNGSALYKVKVTRVK